MIIDKHNYRTALKVGLRFKIDYASIRHNGMRPDIQERAKQGRIWTVIEFNSVTVTYNTDPNVCSSKETESNLNRFIEGMKWIAVDIEFNNKGKEKCVSCGTATERRRDFSDMSIREFCPRCRR